MREPRRCAGSLPSRARTASPKPSTPPAWTHGSPWADHTARSFGCFCGAPGWPLRCPSWNCRENGGPVWPTTTSDATAWGSTTTTGCGPPSPCPVTGGRTTCSPPATARCSTATASTSTHPTTAVDASSRSRASSTRPTCGSMAPTWATRRATSSRTRSTSPTSRGWPSTTCWPSRCRARRSATARPSATSPAHCSTATCSTPTGTRVDCGDPSASTTPARCASIACACCAATPTTHAPIFVCTPDSMPTPNAPWWCARRSTATSSPSNRVLWPRA